MPTSQNGWSANDVSVTDVQTIPGTVRAIRLRKGDAGWLLRHFAAWFDKHVESIDNDGQLDDWGYAERPIRGSAYTLSNHASGTAIDLNAPEHPLGVRGTFTDAQERAIRDQLRKYDGAIRWGGDYSGRPDEMHFEINSGPEVVAYVAATLRNEEDDMTPAERKQFAAEVADEVYERLKADRRRIRRLVRYLRSAMKQQGLKVPKARSRK